MTNKPNVDYFPPDYATARARFRTAAMQAGWKWEERLFIGKGPDGEPLAMDVALSPEKVVTSTATTKPHTTNRPVIVVSSGLHGVEGFLGSAVQLAVLENWAEWKHVFEGRFLLLHALNPFGFAHLRRFDAENIDPNRNFLLREEAFQGAHPMYAQLNKLLNPTTPPNRWDFFLLRALGLIFRHGITELKQAIATGQYEFPKGLFFGGKGPSETQRQLREVLSHYLQPSDNVVHLDFHTGLGPWGEVKLLLDYAPSERQTKRLDAWFGRANYESNDENRTAYQARGGLGAWCIEQQFSENYLPLCVEFGTYGPVKVLSVLRQENRGHHWSQPTDDATRQAKRQLWELFCPASQSWREKVLATSLQLIRQTAQGLATDSATSP